ncbi:MAG: hypothetical protein ACRCZF_06665 [Gemmataceae bacterium]
MNRWNLLAAVLCVGLAGAFVVADDKKPVEKTEKKDEKKADESPLIGTWVREAEGIEVRFEFKKETAVVFVNAGGNSISCKAKYTVDKENVVKVTITDVEEKGDFPQKPAKGFEFTMKVVVDKDKKKAKMSDFTAEGAEAAKPVIEGEYEAKKSD